MFVLLYFALLLIVVLGWQPNQSVVFKFQPPAFKQNALTDITSNSTDPGFGSCPVPLCKPEIITTALPNDIQSAFSILLTTNANGFLHIDYP